MAPFEGDLRLISAMIATVSPRRASARDLLTGRGAGASSPVSAAARIAADRISSPRTPVGGVHSSGVSCISGAVRLLYGIRQMFGLLQAGNLNQGKDMSLTKRQREILTYLTEYSG